MSENVKELLEEVKNLSELMLGLAYSSIFFENVTIAKEVLDLYNELENLEENLYLHLFAASGDDKKNLISVIDIVESSKFVANAARNMSEIVIEGKPMHPIIKEALKESDETIGRKTVSKDSICIGKTLGETKIRTETGIHIIAIRRDKKWIFNPSKKTTLSENDTLIMTGPNESIEKFYDVIEGKSEKL